MRRPAGRLGAAAIALAVGCTPGPKLDTSTCATWEGLGAVRVNPAGAPDRHFRLQAAFRVCPLESGLAEIERKRIELRHEVIALLSAQTLEQLQDPLRAERLRAQLVRLCNERVLKKSRATEVFITGMELE